MIPHNKPSIGLEESQAIVEVISSGWIAPGEKVKQFEQAFAAYVGAKHAVAVSSGTAALTVALKALDMIWGNEIIISTYACAAIINAIHLIIGTYPYLVDVDKSDFNIDIDNIEKALLYKRDCIIIPHIYGVPVGIQQFKQFGLPIIEDCAQALGSYINDKHVGTFGDIGIFSFGPSKMITTGSGGMLVTNNKDLADRARDYINYDGREEYKPRFNFAMNDLQAAMGLVQLKKLDQFLLDRKTMAKLYKDICHIKNWNYQGKNINFYDKNHYRFVLIGDFVYRLKQHLADNEITAIVPIERWELLHNYLGMDASGYPNAEHISTNTLSLPIWPDLLENGFEKVMQTLRSF